MGLYQSAIVNNFVGKRILVCLECLVEGIFVWMGSRVFLEIWKVFGPCLGSRL